MSLLNPVNLSTRADQSTGKTSNIDHFLVSPHYFDENLSIGTDLGSDHSVILMCAGLYMRKNGVNGSRPSEIKKVNKVKIL